MPMPLPALDVQPPQQTNMLQQYGNLMRLEALRQQTQMQQQEAPLRQQALQQQVQGGQLANQDAQLQLQQRQQAVKDQQTVQAALADPQNQGKTIGEVLPSLRGKISLPTFANLANTDFKLRQGLASLDASQLANRKNAYGQLQGIYDSVQEMQPDQLAASWPELANQINGVSKTGGLNIALDPSKPMTLEQLDQYAPLLQLHDAYVDQAMKRKLTGAQIQAAQLAPVKVANEKAYQQAQLRLSQQRNDIAAQHLKLQSNELGENATGQPTDLSRAIASGHVAPERLSYLLTRNPGLIQGVLQIDPSFDSSKAAAYPKVYQDFTSGKTSIALNAGATALGHLEELKELNTDASHIPHTASWTRYQNKATTLATELAKFYGDATIPAIESIRNSLTSTLPGNRDAAIETQAQSMGDKFDAYRQQWENAAPSQAYEAPMPGISQKALSALRSLAPESAGSVSGTATAGKPDFVYVPGKGLVAQ